MKRTFLSAGNFKLLLIILLTCVLQAGKTMAQSPSVTAVIKPNTGVYKAGDFLTYTVRYSEPVIVDISGGVPYLNLNIGNNVRRASYSGKSSSTDLTFVYEVTSNDLDEDGIGMHLLLEPNGSTIMDLDGNFASIILLNQGNSPVYIDAVSPVVNSVSVPAAGYYTQGANLDFTVQFSENIISNIVSGQAYIELTIGNAVVPATLFSQTSNSLTFRYTVGANDRDEDGISIGNTIVLNGTTIVDIVGNSANTALNNVGSTNGVILLDQPKTEISGLVKSNMPWTVIILFSDPVTGFDISDIIVSNATLSNFQVVDGKTYTALVSPIAESLVDLRVNAFVAYNAAGAGNKSGGSVNYHYDATPPVITSVDVPADGIYKTGDVLNFVVHFSEPVGFFTMPSPVMLPVTIGNTQVGATFVTGNRTNAFKYSYTVKDGEVDNDGISMGAALQYNGEMFTDFSNNPLSPIFNNVGNTSQIYVNPTTPGVSLSTTAAAIVNAPFTVTLTFTEAVTGLDVSEISVVNASVSSLQTSDNITYTALITPLADGTVSASLPAGVATNVVNVNTASNTLTLTYDHTPPQITAGQHFSIPQTAAVGTSVGTVIATPVPLKNWIIATDGASGAFLIDANGVVKVQNSAILNTLAGTTVTLAITVSDGLNISASMPVTIDVIAVNKAPQLDPIQDISHCAGTAAGTLQLTGASATEPGQTYTISVAADQPFFDVLSVDAAHVLNYQLKQDITSGSTSVTVTIVDNGGTADGGIDTLLRTFTFTLNSLPDISISSDRGTTIAKGVIANLTASAGIGNYTYNWADADGILSGKQHATLEVRPMANTVYEVTATDNAGCSNTASFSMSVSGVLDILPHNFITPNGDGKNDKWIVRNLELYPDNEVKVYDRAGRLVYSRRNYSNDWDGTINGKQLEEGTYYYFLDINNGLQVIKGFVTIVRDIR